MSYYQPPPLRPPENGLNTASLVLGIISLVIPLVGVITAPLAVIFAFSIPRAERNGQGVAGLVTGLVALAGYLTFFIIAVIVPLFGASTAV